jgi:5-methylcytosine-specific restriction protein A
MFKLLGERQEWRCSHCRNRLESTAQIDHVVPLGDGGTNHLDNLQILCVSCHARKTDREARLRSTFYSPYFVR